MFCIFYHFLNTELLQVAEIFPHERQAPAYFTQPVSCSLMPWQRKEPGHQQPWHWSSLPGTSMAWISNYKCISNSAISFCHDLIAMCHSELVKNFFASFFSCDQAALWIVQPSVRPSARLSHLFHYVLIIMKFSGVITNDPSEVHAKGQGQRSKFRATEVKALFSRFRTVTPV